MVALVLTLATLPLGIVVVVWLDPLDWNDRVEA